MKRRNEMFIKKGENMKKPVKTNKTDKTNKTVKSVKPVKKEDKKVCTECETAQPIKRGRGRPRKNPLVNVSTINTSSVSAFNTSNISNTPNIPKKRGRPRKVIVYTECNTDPIVPTKTFKALGYCPSCKLCIGVLDLIISDNSKYRCARCDKEGLVKDLLEKIDLGDRPRNKKEYLQSISSQYNGWNDYGGSKVGLGGLGGLEKAEENIHKEELEDDLIGEDPLPIVPEEEIEIDPLPSKPLEEDLLGELGTEIIDPLDSLDSLE